ncbi:MAG: hypothetical protein AAF514_21325 [Verrucomicrobiota bacterium]
MSLDRQWKIRKPGHNCSHTGEPFKDEQEIHTVIFHNEETEELERRDYSNEGWEAVCQSNEITPFSFWKGVYHPPEKAPEPQVIKKENAEELLFRLIREDDPKTQDARYILAIMLERKRIVVQEDAQEDDGTRLLFFRHRKTDEVFMVEDPRLQLDQLDQVQSEVADLLGAPPKIRKRSVPAPPNDHPEDRAESAGGPVADEAHLMAAAV